MLSVNKGYYINLWAILKIMSARSVFKQNKILTSFAALIKLPILKII